MKSASENALTAKEHTGLGHHNLRGLVSNPCDGAMGSKEQRDTNASEAKLHATNSNARGSYAAKATERPLFNEAHTSASCALTSISGRQNL